MTQTPRRRARLAVRADAVRRGLLGAILLCALAPTAAPDHGTAHDPSKVEAAYLRNFARYVAWPEGAFRGPGAPWQIGVLGRDELGEVLERTLQGRTEQDRAFEVHRGRSADALRDCHIVFVGYGDPARRRAALAELKGRPILTVGDADGFLDEGGTVEFAVRDTVQMSISLDQARVAALRIPTKMLEVSRAVVENGVTRVLR